MLRQQSRAADDPVPDRPEAALPPDLEPVRVRNHDHHEGHSVHVTLEALDGATQLSERSYLAPGQSTRVADAIEPGTYRLRVRVDGVERRRSVVELDGTPRGTAVLELGNGAVSVTEGV